MCTYRLDYFTNCVSAWTPNTEQVVKSDQKQKYCRRFLILNWIIPEKNGEKKDF